MAVTIQLASGARPGAIGLDVWMARTLDRAEQVQSGWEADDVHDLRVALRRCRTMAEALSEVYPDPGWRKLKKTSRATFHALGELRDTQVERQWVKKLGPPGSAARRYMLRVLMLREREQREAASKALDHFDRKEWKRLNRKLDSKARFFPLESVVFQRLALARLNEAVRLYELARKRRSTLAWHRLRIGIKSFRYVVENFLPQRYEVWASALKKSQDLLGELHDLDVSRSDIRRHGAKLDQKSLGDWLARIDRARKARIAEFVSMASGPGALWINWRSGFQSGLALVAASFPERRTA
jgi:CHAD domain-containing protein